MPGRFNGGADAGGGCCGKQDGAVLHGETSLSVWPVPPIFAAVEVIAAARPFEQN
jgi:hypothetical protein